MGGGCNRAGCVGGTGAEARRRDDDQRHFSGALLQRIEAGTRSGVVGGDDTHEILRLTKGVLNGSFDTGALNVSKRAVRLHTTPASLMQLPTAGSRISSVLPFRLCD